VDCRTAAPQKRSTTALQQISSKNDTSNWDVHREAQCRYRKEVRKASKESWRTFCSSVKDLPRSARINRALFRDPKIRLGSLVAPTRQRTQSEADTLNLLRATHFPNSVGMEGGTLPEAVGCTNRAD